MKRSLVNLIGLALVVLLSIGACLVGAWECAAAPESQCQDGSTKVTHGNATKLYECHNGSWIQVTCFNGTARTTHNNRGTYHYTCRGNEWKRDG